MRIVNTHRLIRTLRNTCALLVLLAGAAGCAGGGAGSLRVAGADIAADRLLPGSLPSDAHAFLGSNALLQAAAAIPTQANGSGHGGAGGHVPVAHHAPAAGAIRARAQIRAWLDFGQEYAALRAGRLSPQTTALPPPLRG